MKTDFKKIRPLLDLIREQIEFAKQEYFLPGEIYERLGMIIEQTLQAGFFDADPKIKLFIQQRLDDKHPENPRFSHYISAWAECCYWLRKRYLIENQLDEKKDDPPPFFSLSFKKVVVKKVPEDYFATIKCFLQDTGLFMDYLQGKPPFPRTWGKAFRIYIEIQREHSEIESPEMAWRYLNEYGNPDSYPDYQLPSKSRFVDYVKRAAGQLRKREPVKGDWQGPIIGKDTDYGEAASRISSLPGTD